MVDVGAGAIRRDADVGLAAAGFAGWGAGGWAAGSAGGAASTSPGRGRFAWQL